MGQVEIRRQSRFDLCRDRAALCALGDHHMGLIGVLAFIHLPQMRVMDVDHPVDGAHRISNAGSAQVWRTAQHQNPHHRPHIRPRVPQDIPRNHQRDHRIDPAPVEQQDQRPRHDHRHTAQRIRQIMHKRGADVQAVLGHRIG